MSKKIPYSLEFDINASPRMLYQYLSTPSGLSKWFSHDVNLKGKLFTFVWGDSEESARLISKKIDEQVRFQWQNGEPDEDKYYFEFKIQIDEITKDVSLIISDFSEEDELEESKMLWNNLISDLKQALGSY